ncbi:hypothetical protein ACF0H5_018916 [Mactra antiquata]
MAFLRFVKRRLGFFGVVLFVTVFWIFYLILSAPAASDSKYHNGVLPHDSTLSKHKESVTRRVMVPQPNRETGIFEKTVGQPNKPPSDSDIHGEDAPVKQVIPRPPPEINEPVGSVKPFGDNINVVDIKQNKIEIESKDKGEDIEKTVGDKDEKVETGKIVTPVKPEKSVNADVKNVTLKVPTKPANATSKKTNNTEPPVLKKVENKVKEMGESLKNKTIGDWEKMKNKTIEKLQDFGVIKKPDYIKLIYSPVKWPLNLSFEAIGNIMKDTQYLKVQQNLTDMDYQPLMVSNGTNGFNISESRYGLGYCDCKDLQCSCCVRVYNKWMMLNSTACSFITFSSAAQELTFEYSMDKTKIFERKIAAEFPPKICLESTSKAAGICTLFSNVTAKVNIASENHKINLSGCMEYDLTLYNRTVSSFPVGCFQIPGKQSKESEENPAQNLGNFMP